MILAALNDLYDRLARDADYAVAPPGYSLQNITFRVVLEATGELCGIQDARASIDGNLRARQVLVLGAGKPSGSGLNPCLLWDNSAYLLGFRTEDDKPDRTRRSFIAFRDRHLALEQEIDSPAFSAVCRFLEAWRPSDGANFPTLVDAAATGFGVFQLRGETRHVHDDEGIERWWHARLGRTTSTVRGHCLVSGQERPLARLHPKIKGVVGAQGAGAAIVSFNEDAYESYGKSQSFNAPVSEEVVFRYTTALNALLAGPMRRRHRFRLGETTVVFWAERAAITEDIFARFAIQGSRASESASDLDEGQRLKLEAFLQALRQGREAYADLDDTADRLPFYILGLAPNAARLSIRFLYRGTVAELLDNLRRHHADIAMVRRPAGGRRAADPEFPSVAWLLEQTAPTKGGKPDRDKIPPILTGPLLRAVVMGSRYPDGMFAAVLRRIRADATVSYLRACVVKGYLCRNLGKDVSVSLDPERAEPAYRLGRLFAALEKTQREALPTIKKTIRDSYYSSASATPGSVFPRLLRTYQHHLAKLQGGRRVNRERVVQEILAPLETFPKLLGLPGQGAFAIGYYHQMQDFFTKHDATPIDDVEGDHEE